MLLAKGIAAVRIATIKKEVRSDNDVMAGSFSTDDDEAAPSIYGKKPDVTQSTAVHIQV
jgi:hypothetical protein